MKFSCDKNTILKEISVAQDIIASRNVLSILSNVLLEVAEDSLTIKASDLKVSFETRIPVNVEKTGNTTVFCDKLLNILRSLPAGEISFQKEEDERLLIKSGEKINFQLNSISAEKFPAIPQTEKTKFFPMEQKKFIEMVGQTIFSVSDDETRYFMNGVFMEKKEKELIMVATDGRRLSYTVDDPEGPQFEGVIIPPKILNLVYKLALGEGEINLAVTDKVIFLHFDNQKITSTLIDGQFPNYSRVIPEKQIYGLETKRAELLDALRRVSLLAEQKSKRIYITVDGNKIGLRSEENEVGVAEEDIECQYEGPKVTFALNHRYLSDPLKIMNEDNVCLKFTESNKAITVLTVPETNCFHIIMPMQMD